jgi:micrococcal nuclease
LRSPLLLASICLISASFTDRLAAACDLPEPETATVASVQDGETLKLTDGRVVRLIGAKAPAPPLGWRGDDPWPLVADAGAALSRLASGAEIELRFGGRRTDRHGQLLAQVFVVRDGALLWLQEEMVARGLARVYSLADNTACIHELLAREAEARDRHLGVWGSWAYRIQSADDLKRLDRLIHTYQLVEGKVVAVGQGAGRIYLNFAEDWRRDFTVSVARKDVDAFAAAGIDLKELAGKTIRVRGWLQWRNGPMIEATHPEQIELVPNTAGKEAL